MRLTMIYPFLCIMILSILTNVPAPNTRADENVALATAISQPHYRDETVARKLCDSRKEAIHIRDKALREILYLEGQLKEVEAIRGNARTSEGIRRTVLALVAGYMAAGATKIALSPAMSVPDLNASFYGASETVIGGLFAICEEVGNMVLTGGAFVATAALVDKIGEWLSDSGIEDLKTLGTEAEQTELESLRTSIEKRKGRLEASDQELSVLGSSSLAPYEVTLSSNAPSQLVAHGALAINALRNYQNLLKAQIVDINQATESLQKQIEGFCRSRTLSCAFAIGARWNASTYVELEASLIRDKVLNHTALAIQASKVTATLNALLQHLAPYSSPSATCAP